MFTTQYNTILLFMCMECGCIFTGTGHIAYTVLYVHIAALCRAVLSTLRERLGDLKEQVRVHATQVFIRLMDAELQPPQVREGR